jgi:hypothetical protein
MTDRIINTDDAKNADNSIIIGIDPADTIYITFSRNTEYLGESTDDPDQLNENLADNKLPAKIAVSRSILMKTEFFNTIINRWLNTADKSEIQLSADIPVVAFCEVLKKMRNPKYASKYPEINFYYDYFGLFKNNSQIPLCELSLMNYKEREEAAYFSWYNRIGAMFEEVLRNHDWYEESFIWLESIVEDKEYDDNHDNTNVAFLEQTISNYESSPDDKSLIYFLTKNKYYCFSREYDTKIYISIFNKKLLNGDKTVINYS